MSSRRRSTVVSVGLLLLIALLVALVLPLGARAADKIKDLVQIGNTPDNPVPVAQAGRWSVDVGAPTVKLDPAGNGVKVLNGDANSIPVHLASKKEPFSTIVDVAIEDQDGLLRHGSANRGERGPRDGLFPLELRYG
jgi:hypothetical protein